VTGRFRTVLVASFWSGACACTVLVVGRFYSLLNNHVVTLYVDTTTPHKVTCWGSARLAVVIIMEVFEVKNL
jgi:hypothetical protein